MVQRCSAVSVRRTVGCTLLVLAVSGPALAQVSAAQEDPCLPVTANSYWTNDDVYRNERIIAQAQNTPGARVDPPIANPYLSKYLDCKRWLRDSETYITRDLLLNFELMQGVPRLFDDVASIPLGYAGLQRLGPMGDLIKGKISKGLHDVLFGDLEKTGIVPVIENMFLQLQKEHPNDSLEAILGRISGELRRPGSGFTGLAPETIKFFESTVRDLGVRQMLGQWRPNQVSPPQVAAAKDKLIKADQALAKKSKDVATAKQQAGKVGDSLGKIVAPVQGPDWKRLTGLYRRLVSSSGREQAEELLAKAASDPALQKQLGLSETEAKALAADIASKANLRNAADAAKEIAAKSKELAELAGQLGWAEGAFQFANLASAASSFERIAGALASSAGPPGPWQFVGAANGAFALAGALSNAFGGRQQKDDGLAKALNQIMEGLRSINRQLADMRQEQREHFAYAERFLDLLVEVASADALSGVTACQRTLIEYAGWTRTSGTTDVRAALKNPGPSSALRLRAAQCKDWLWEDRNIPLGPSGVNVVYKQLLATAKDLAAKHLTAMAEFKNRGFIRVEVQYPQLWSLVELAEADRLLSERRNWLDEPTKPVDISERMAMLGHVVGADWTVARLGGQLLSSSTVVTVAEAALLLQPAAAALKADGTLVVQSESDADASNNTHASVLRDIYGLSLTALAQESLIAGAPIAALVDQLLEQGDARDAQLQVDKCAEAKRMPRLMCGLELGVPAESPTETCALEPKPDAKTLCARLGIRAFEDKVKAARAAVANFPALRQNVLAVRLWRLSSRSISKQRWAPGYALALNQRVDTLDASLDPGAIAVSRLFGGLEVMQLGAEKVALGDARGDRYLEDGIYFARLSGACEGLKERALLGIAVCKQGRCDHRVGKDDEGRLRILDVSTDKPRAADAKDDIPEACVMAALPSAQDFEQGDVFETESLVRVRSVVERLAMAVVFDQVYASRLPGRHSDRWTIIDSLRPAGSSFTASGGSGE